MDEQAPQSNPLPVNPPVENTVVQPTPPAIPPSSKSFFSGKLLLLIVAILLLIFAGGGTYLALNSKNKPAPVVSKFTPTSAPTPTIDPIASWKTYTSKQARYSFKYPNEWPINNIAPAKDCSVCVEDIIFSPEVKLNSGDSNISVILVLKDERIKTLEDYKNIFIKHSSSYTDVKDVTLGEEKALSYKLSGGIPPLPVSEYVVVKNGFYYEIRLEDSIETNKNKLRNLELFKQILSTFRFD